eukprot:scaffold6353_cov51-Phaeocystis_antarctica.AAC.1
MQPRGPLRGRRRGRGISGSLLDSWSRLGLFQPHRGMVRLHGGQGPRQALEQGRAGHQRKRQGQKGGASGMGQSVSHPYTKLNTRWRAILGSTNNTPPSRLSATSLQRNAGAHCAGRSLRRSAASTSRLCISSGRHRNYAGSAEAQGRATSLQGCHSCPARARDHGVAFGEKAR